MTQLIINIESPGLLRKIKGMLEKIHGITINEREISGIEEAMEDVKSGRVNHYKSVEELFNSLDL